MSDTKELFGVRITASLLVPTANTNTQLMLVNWKKGRKVKLKKVIISNRSANRGRVVIWDQDLSDSSVPATGSATAPLLELGVDAVATAGIGSATAKYAEYELPSIEFQAGIALQVSEANMFIAVEVEEY